MWLPATLCAMAIRTVLLANGKNGALVEHRFCSFRNNLSIFAIRFSNLLPLNNTNTAILQVAALNSTINNKNVSEEAFPRRPMSRLKATT